MIVVATVVIQYYYSSNSSSCAIIITTVIVVVIKNYLTPQHKVDFIQVSTIDCWENIIFVLTGLWSEILNSGSHTEQVTLFGST